MHMQSTATENVQAENPALLGERGFVNKVPCIAATEHTSEPNCSIVIITTLIVSSVEKTVFQFMLAS